MKYLNKGEIRLINDFNGDWVGIYLGNGVWRDLTDSNQYEVSEDKVADDVEADLGHLFKLNILK